MPLEGTYEPSAVPFVRAHVEEYESSGGTSGAVVDGNRVVILTSRGASSGTLRKTPVMRVESQGTYAVIASQGGSRRNPAWCANLRADAHVELQDGPTKRDMVAREVHGAECATWWRRAVAVYRPYGEYQTRTDRLIPVFVLEPAG